MKWNETQLPSIWAYNAWKRAHTLGSLYFYRSSKGKRHKSNSIWMVCWWSACQGKRHKRHWFHPWVGTVSLEEGTATHSSILAWRIPWTEEPGGPQSMELPESQTWWRLNSANNPQLAVLLLRKSGLGMVTQNTQTACTAAFVWEQPEGRPRIVLCWDSHY